MQYLTHLSFCQEPYALLSLALEKWFNGCRQQVQIVSDCELIFCSPNTIPIEGKKPFEIINIPIENPVSITRVKREKSTLDPRTYEDGTAAVKLGDRVIFSGPLEEAAKTVYQLLIADAKMHPHYLVEKAPLKTLASIIADKQFPWEIREAAEALRDIIEPTSACVAIEYTRDSYRFMFSDPFFVELRKKVQGSFAIRRMPTGYYDASSFVKPLMTEIFFCPYHRPLLRMALNDLRELLYHA